MKKEELLIYEVPTISGFISNKWLQELVAKYLAWKINKKWRRYEYRIHRSKYLAKLKDILGEV